MENIVMYLVVTCNDKTSVTSDEYVTDIKGLQAIVIFILKVRGDNVITSTYK